MNAPFARQAQRMPLSGTGLIARCNKTTGVFLGNSAAVSVSYEWRCRQGASWHLRLLPVSPRPGQGSGSAKTFVVADDASIVGVPA